MGQLKLYIEVDDEGSNYKASGNMTVGNIKLVIGEMELIKKRLLDDLESSTEEIK